MGEQMARSGLITTMPALMLVCLAASCLAHGWRIQTMFSAKSTEVINLQLFAVRSSDDVVARQMGAWLHMPLSKSFTYLLGILCTQLLAASLFRHEAPPFLSAWRHFSTSIERGNLRAMFRREFGSLAKRGKSLVFSFGNLASLLSYRHPPAARESVFSSDSWCGSSRDKVIAFSSIASVQCIHPMLLTVKQIICSRYLKYGELKSLLAILLPGSLEVSIAMPTSPQIGTMHIPPSRYVGRASHVDTRCLGVCNAINACRHSINYTMKEMEKTFEHRRDQGL